MTLAKEPQNVCIVFFVVWRGNNTMERTIQEFYNTLFTKDTQYNYDTFLLKKLQTFLFQ
jgi:hypothetical protein